MNPLSLIYNTNYAILLHENAGIPVEGEIGSYSCFLPAHSGTSGHSFRTRLSCRYKTPKYILKE